MEDLTKDNKVVLNIENYNGDKPIELIVREGKAATQPDPLPTKAPIPVKFAGTLLSVTEWLGKRVSEIDQKHAFVKVDRENNTITLIINENDPYLKGEIQGTIAFTDDYKRIGINDPNKAWEPNKLGQFFRLNRAMFKDKESSMKLVSNLKNFTANAKTEIQKQKDPSGSRADVYKSQVESNLPKSFQINLGIIKGMAKTTVEVEFDHYLSDGECYLQLISPGCKEAVDEYVASCIDAELDKIKEIAPDIAILEQ